MPFNCSEIFGMVRSLICFNPSVFTQKGELNLTDKLLNSLIFELRNKLWNACQGVSLKNLIDAQRCLSLPV